MRTDYVQVVKRCQPEFKDALVTESLSTFYGHYRVKFIAEHEVDDKLLDTADEMYLMGGEL